MIQTNNVFLDNIVVHKVGNKLDDEGIRYSKSEVALDLDIKKLLTSYFFSPFKEKELYNFSHDYNLSLNEIFTYASKCFEKELTLFDFSKYVAQHLYNKSAHPQVKSGELYVTNFTDCIVDGKMVSGIGVFKSESKETYLRVFPKGDSFEINSEAGININRLDKGCLIFNTEKESGYLVAIVDNINRGNEAKYWKDDFLQLKSRQDEYFHTQNVIALCKNFTANAENLNQAQKAEILNKAVDYFKISDNFDMDDFTNQILEGKDLVDDFKTFRINYEQERDLVIIDDFTVSEEALKKQIRTIKNSIKLDNNFKISINGDTRYLEKGYDENKRLNYYKLYFSKEE